MRFSKFLLPLLTIACLASRPAHAGGYAYSTISAISMMGIFQNYTGASKVVDGIKVYTEGTPMLVLEVKKSDGGKFYTGIPFSGKKAEGILELAKMAGTRQVILYYTEDPSTPKTTCKQFAPEGCLELSNPVEYPLIQGLYFNQ